MAQVFNKQTKKIENSNSLGAYELFEGKKTPKIE